MVIQLVILRAEIYIPTQSATVLAPLYKVSVGCYVQFDTAMNAKFNKTNVNTKKDDLKNYLIFLFIYRN